MNAPHFPQPAHRLSWIRALPLLAAGLSPTLQGAYAPIPPVEQGRPLTVYVAAGTYYDTNIFGGATGEIDSFVYQLAPSLAFNASVAPRTFASFQYRASLDYVADRPGKKLLDNHAFVGRVAHTFNPESELDLSNSYEISKNPESLLPGVGAVSGDQSFRRNQFDGRLSRSLTRRTGLLGKVRSTRYAYESEGLARDLDRSEWIAGVTAAHAFLPTLKSNAEYRYQQIDYRAGGAFKNKRSHFLLGGLDYAPGDRLAVTGRAGVEYRSREGERDRYAPYVEIGAKRDYAKGSFVAVGYSYSLDETSAIERFTDAAVNRFFVNVQHVLTPKLVATGTVNWEPSVLQGRRGISPDRDETNTRLGVAATYRLRENWSLTANVDIDRVRSDVPERRLSRERAGLSARYVF